MNQSQENRKPLQPVLEYLRSRPAANVQAKCPAVVVLQRLKTARD